MKHKLPESIYTPQDLMTLIVELHDFRRQFSHNAILKKANQKNNESLAVSPAARQLMAEYQTKTPLTQADIDAIIKDLEAIKSSANQMTITLAAPATDDIKQRLVGWCRKNIAPDTLVNFSFNTNLLGGMVVRSGSHIYDWSWRRQILAARYNFPEVLHRV